MEVIFGDICACERIITIKMDIKECSVRVWTGVDLRFGHRNKILRAK